MFRAAFFDIDGTLVSFETHGVPDSTVKALAHMRESGVKIILATGRSLLDVHPDLQPGGRIAVDAVLAFNGQLCCDSKGTFRDCPLEEKDVRAVVSQAEAGLYDLILMQQTRFLMSRYSDRIRSTEERVGKTDAELGLSDALSEPTYQICAYIDEGEEGIFMHECSNVEFTRWCDGFCDIIPKGGGKPAGIKAALARYGIEPDECIAFGDGGNDIAMFGCVGQSVAMGEASVAVKAAPSYVTSNVDDDGILRACEHFGLL